MQKTAVCSLFVSSVFLLTAAAQSVNVLTYHNNNQRTGFDPLETTLTLVNVNSGSFGKVGFLAADGKVDAEPLYVSNLLVNGEGHNVVYIVSEHDTIYAYDADDGTLLWQTTALLSGETPSDDLQCSSLTPEIGISATPVIDPAKGPHGVIYFVGMSKDAKGIKGINSYHQRLHALDLTTGIEMFGGPVEIQARYPGTGDDSQNGYVIFDPRQYFVRAGLLEVDDDLYFGFASHCDYRPYTGWLMKYSASTLAQLSVLNVTPNGNSGAIWQSGGGLAADSDGYVYFLDANGTFDTTLNGKGFPINGDFGNAFIKVSGSHSAITGALQVVDYFTMYDTVDESNNDVDLGSGGPVVVDVPSGHNFSQANLVVGAGKDASIYVANRNNMGKWNSNNNNNIYQEVMNTSPYGSWSPPAFFNNTLYYGGVADNIKAWPFVLGRLTDQPSSQTSITFTYPGTTPSISANFAQDGILWAIENTTPAVLHAYNALDLTQELYNSNQQGSRDQFGPGNKFITPMIANGRVYVGTQTGVAVFGLLQ